MRILLAEDNTAINQLVRTILESEGYQVTAVDNGLEALQQALMQRFDAVVLDGNMPILDGWETCRRIKAQSRVPVMMLTVHAETRDREIARNSGADAYMAKPFDIPAFVRELNRLLPAR